MNDEKLLEKLEKVDPLLARTRRWMSYCQRAGDDVADCIEEILQNICTGREWTRKNIDRNQHLEARIEITVTKGGLKVWKNFKIGYPFTSYYQSGLKKKS